MRDLDAHESPYGLTPNDLDGTIDACVDCGSALARHEHTICEPCKEDN